MLIIDFANLSHQRLNATMADIGVGDLVDLPLSIVLERLRLGSERTPEEHFPVQQQTSCKIDLSPIIQVLWKQKKIVDVIGPRKIPQSRPICFSTFVSERLKEYLKQYLKIGKALCELSHDLQFIVWLEDTLTALKNSWEAFTTQQAVNVYRGFFLKEFPESQVLLSSEIAPLGIPQSFTEKLSCITIEEFLSVLPFHLRNLMFVKTLDVIHFAWNCYILHRLPGVYLAGINNKRNFQLFRKVVGSQITVILLPLGSEKIIN